MAIILDGQHRCRTRSLVLKLGYTMESPEKLEKMLMPESWSHDSCVFALGCHLGTRIKNTHKKNSSGDSNKQSLKIISLTYFLKALSKL